MQCLTNGIFYSFRTIYQYTSPEAAVWWKSHVKMDRYASPKVLLISTPKAPLRQRMGGWCGGCEAASKLLLERHPFQSSKALLKLHSSHWLKVPLKSTRWLNASVFLFLKRHSLAHFQRYCFQMKEAVQLYTWYSMRLKPSILRFTFSIGILD